MLTAKVGYTRTVGSNSYTAVLDGDIPATPDDPEVVLAKIGELFALAEEALNVEIERSRKQRSETAQRPVTAHATNAHPTRTEEAITTKQVQYLQNLAKKVGLSGAELDAEIAKAIGRRTTLRGLTKREAGRAIDALRNRPAIAEEVVTARE